MTEGKAPRRAVEAGQRPEPAFATLAKQASAGGAERYHAKAREQGKLFVRERLRRLLDSADGFAEDGLLANAMAGDLPADGPNRQHTCGTRPDRRTWL